MDARNAIGIDLTMTEWKPAGCAVLDSGGALAWLSKNTTDASIIELAVRHFPAVVAIDSPLGFPKGMDCLDSRHHCESVHDFKGRACERDLRRARKPQIAIYATVKNTPIRHMAIRAISLAEKMRARGVEVIEVYPYASKRALFGNVIPKAKTPAEARFVTAGLKPLIPGLEAAPESLEDDLLDALIAAYTARLYAQGRTTAFGIPEEGLIHTPVFREEGESRRRAILRGKR